MYGIIYLAVNRKNGKAYVGQTIRGLKRRKTEHINASLVCSRDESPLHKAIKKYGKRHFSWEILERCASKKELNECEEKWIAFYNSFDRRCGYNLTTGGGQYKQSKETILKRAEKLRGHTVSRETRKKISRANKGHVMSEEQKEQLRKCHTGHKYGERHRMLSSKNNRGSKNHAATITEKTATRIKELLNTKMTHKEIALLLGTSKNVVALIGSGKTWKHVGSEVKSRIISTETVIKIKSMLANKISRLSIAEELNVSKTVVTEIACGRTWRHIHVA
jgi:group I intron endonuclease